MFYKNTALVGLLTVTVATAAAYVLWGPPHKKKTRKKDYAPGLENLGNTCFLNAVLQALAPCQSILDWLSKILLRKHMNKTENYLAYTMLKTLKVLTNKTFHDKDTFCPSEVLNALRSRWVIPDDEQDAHELFHALTQTLAEETGHYPKVLSLFDVSALQSPDNEYQTCKSAVTRSKGLLPVLPRDTDHPFRGHFASQLTCQSCAYCYPVKYDLFDSLSLNIPESHWGPLSLEILLQKFITSETVFNVDCPGCTNKSDNISQTKVVQSTFLKKLSIGKLPQCLCLHIPRTHWLNNNVPVKRFERISFPETLQMDEFIYMGVGSAGEKDRKNWLFGGRASNVNRSLTRLTSSSAAVNLLRALNHHSQTTMNEFLATPALQSAMYSNVQTDVNQNGPNPPKYDLSAHTYRLIAVIEHIGDVVSGHFVSYRRCPTSKSGEKHSDKWLFTSDTVVKKVSLSQVLNSEAYMLFYEKV
ncbi:ubiquitin carboxyl-terminal hydrolase 30 [Octopus bimaculoides]|uniref:Ubiquitin carboxyl-terminal hydrolase n=1 Tax=Octopus bimaculoides TaxID=37653 RepID=A0A0L8FTP9_OCTBM|nr:ubiquitin carboxyl-terminal hydrolase 30 [Octopus bimaculoides]|eukprot:XP_014786998.1 PREDICTED: ubiquitin carboxyl-terminal hydrolase 30-like isoform X2 [Octopus bimaculoides]